MRSCHVIFQKLWVDRSVAHATYTPKSTIRVLYFKHHVIGEAWPADSDSTLKEGAKGEGIVKV